MHKDEAMIRRSLYSLWSGITRGTLCKLGHHTKPSGRGFDACGRGCGFAWNPNAPQGFVVRLKDGSVHQVHAINRYHAESLVVYGGGPVAINADGTPRGEVKVHRANILSVDLPTEFAG